MKTINKRKERAIYEKNRKEMLIDDTKIHYYRDQNFLCVITTFQNWVHILLYF